MDTMLKPFATNQRDTQARRYRSARPHATTLTSSSVHSQNGLRPGRGSSEIIHLTRRRAFDDLVRAGKILYIGLSDLPAWQASRMQAIAELRGWSLPLGGGMLAGKYSQADLVPPDMKNLGSRKAINAVTGRLSERNLSIAEVVAQIAQELGKTSAQVAIAWTLANPAVTAPVIGMRTVAQLKDNLGALDVELSADHIARLNAVSDVPRVFPMDILKSPAEGMMFGNVKVGPRG
jgi:aryl-alcohol dehydrogenase-like predicted oxidoreductase